MTIEEVAMAVLEIDKTRHDDEAAHWLEAKLYESVLRAIADGADNAADLARCALQTKRIEFDRWCS